ncbi:MAG TPA: DNA polymerase IV [Kribbellaceae bacterium]
MAGWILHVDVDQFICAVEIRRRPELRGRPVLVGGTGDPNQPRTVVAGASYEARAFGVHSGMPMRTAARRCPDAVFLAKDDPAYDAASAEVMAVLRGLDGVVVEVWGWDEAVVGTTTSDPEALAARIRTSVLEQTGLSCCVGISDNKQRAKMATGFAKESPERVFRFTDENWMPVMGDRPTDALWGVGTKSARNLAELGLHTVRELAMADVDMLKRRFGPVTGGWFRMLALGRGDDQVNAEPWVPRSRSKQVTYPADLTERADIERHVADLAREVTAEVVGEGRVVQRVAVTVRTASFFTRTKIRKLPSATTDGDVVARAALAVLDGFPLDRPVRLLGVRAELVPLDP